MTAYSIIVILLLLSCLPNRPEVICPPHSVSGMTKISAAGKSFLQGASDSNASEDEKPVMTASFSYDYWIDTIEVTQHEYAACTGKRPVKDSCAFGAGDDYPVYFVSWFDAILFCNERSKKENLDTVYSYFGQPLEQKGSVYDLAGVQIHYDRDGYRLPTESEWEYAAREGASAIPFPGLSDSVEAKRYAWYFTNSLGHTHQVSLREKNIFGLYDMAGNVYEWTADWRSPYSVPRINNSIGAIRPNSGNERVVKGGSFEHGFHSLRFSRRSSNYGTPHSTAAEYIGFRCARGAFEHASLITADTASVTTLPVSIVVTSLQSMLPRSLAKVVFVNVNNYVRTLCAVDFERSFPIVSEYRDCKTVFTPVISPNGKFVAFGTRNEGLAGAAAIYLRSLDSLGSPLVKIPADSAYDPRFWVDPAVRDTFLIFTNSSIDNSLPLWTSSQTYMIKISGGKPVGAPQVLATNGSFHDGRSANGQYIVTGFTQLFMRDLTTNTDAVLFTYPHNGKEANGSTQVCNVSMSPDSNNNGMCLFLDFGCPSISTLTGERYGLHAYLFTARFSGEIASWYKCPAGDIEWNYPEWSNVAPLAIACGMNDAEEAHAVYLIDLQNHRTLKILEGGDLEHPFLWVNPSIYLSEDKIDLDSLGNYNSPSISYPQPFFAARMLAFWQEYKHMKLVFTGSSQTTFGVDPRKFTIPGVYNMAIPGGDFPVQTAMIMGYLLNHCDSLKLIGMDLILPLLFAADIAFVPDWDTGIISSKGYNYDKNHQFWSQGLPLSFSSLIHQIPFPAIPDFDTLGVYWHACEGWGGPTPDHWDDPKSTTDDPVYRTNIALVKNFARDLARRGIHFLLYLPPVSPYYKDHDVYVSAGPTLQAAAMICNDLIALQDSVPGYFHFYDADKMGAHDYTDADAFDVSHLCTAGAEKFSMRLDSVVKTILK
jgi:uncharacterized protein (TIGR02171 family)